MEYKQKQRKSMQTNTNTKSGTANIGKNWVKIIKFPTVIIHCIKMSMGDNIFSTNSTIVGPSLM